MIKKSDGPKLRKLKEGWRFIQIKVNYDYWKRVKAAAALYVKRGGFLLCSMASQVKFRFCLPDVY
jgi:hypothetical protein